MAKCSIKTNADSYQGYFLWPKNTRNTNTSNTTGGVGLRRPLCPIGNYLRTTCMLKDWACCCQTSSGVAMFFADFHQKSVARAEPSMRDILLRWVPTHTDELVQPRVSCPFTQVLPFRLKSTTTLFPPTGIESLTCSLPASCMWPHICHSLRATLEGQVTLVELG